MSEIIEQIRIIKKLKTETQVAKILDIPKQNLSSFKTRNAIPFEKIIVFCEQENISFDWLVLGIDKQSDNVVTHNDLKKQLDRIEKLIRD